MNNKKKKKNRWLMDAICWIGYWFGHSVATISAVVAVVAFLFIVYKFFLWLMY